MVFIKVVNRGYSVGGWYDQPATPVEFARAAARAALRAVGGHETIRVDVYWHGRSNPALEFGVEHGRVVS